MSEELRALLDEIYGYLISKIDDIETLDKDGITNQVTSLMSKLINLIGKMI